LSAAYMLTLIQKIFYGPTSEAVDANSGVDLSFREKLILWPLVVLMLIMGVLPNLWLTGIETAVKPLSAQEQTQVKINPKQMLTLSIKDDRATAGVQQ